MKRVRLIREMKDAFPIVPIGTVFVVDKLGQKEGVIFATPIDDITKNPLFRRQYVLFKHEYEVIE